MNKFLMSAVVLMVHCLLSASSSQRWRPSYALLDQQPIASRNNADPIQTLMALGADVNQYDLLSTAMDNDYEVTAQLLIGAGANIDRSQGAIDSPLMWATKRGHSVIVQMLIDAQADVHYCNNNGWFALLLAAQHGNYAIARILVEAGARVNQRDMRGRFALLLAARRGYDKVVQLLLEAGTEVNDCDHNGWNSLILAAHNGHETTTRILLQSGAHVTFSTLAGAISQCHSDVVRVLFLRGAKALTDPQYSHFSPEGQQCINDHVHYACDRAALLTRLLEVRYGIPRDLIRLLHLFFDTAKMLIPPVDACNTMSGACEYR